MVGNKNQHTKALLDMLEYVSNSIGYDFEQVDLMDTTAQEGYERVSCRFADGVGVTIIVDKQDEEL